MATAEERATAPNRDWSALPDLALAVVALRLRSLSDFLAFRRVCRCWWLAAKAAKRDFAASLPPFLFWDFQSRGLLCPTDGRFYWKRDLRKAPLGGLRVVGYSHGHLILLSWQKPWLLNPFTGAEVRDFPCSPPNVYRAVLSSPPASPDFALVVFDRSTVRYCRLGDRYWSFLYERIRSREWNGYVEDIAFVGRRGYLLCDAGKLATFDLGGSPKLTVLECKATPIADWNKLAKQSKSLVEFKGELFVFTCGVRALSDLACFLIFQFDEENCKWRRLESIGDRALFVNHGRGGAFVDNCTGWGGSADAVYFLKRHYRSFAVNTFRIDRGDRRIDLFYHHCSDCDQWEKGNLEGDQKLGE